MLDRGELPQLPEALQRLVAISGGNNVISSFDLTTEPKNEGSVAESLPSVSQLLALVRAIRSQYIQLVVDISATSEKTGLGDLLLLFRKRLEELARSVLELQKGIRSKNAQCVRMELRAYLFKEVEERRRALLRMETALSIAKQSV